jgi:hypothetical protein
VLEGLPCSGGMSGGRNAMRPRAYITWRALVPDPVLAILAVKWATMSDIALRADSVTRDEYVRRMPIGLVPAH